MSLVYLAAATGLFIAFSLKKPAPMIDPPDKNHRIVLFYLDLLPTIGKRPLYLKEILEWPLTHDGEMEKNHEFIQWLFPTNQVSQYNRDAPILQPQIADVLREIPLFRRNFGLAFLRFMRFLNINLDPDSLTFQIENSKFFRHITAHNFLRLSRVLQSLQCFGYHKLAQSLHGSLMQINTDTTQNSEVIKSFEEARRKHWTNIMTYPTQSNDPNETRFYTTLKTILDKIRTK